MRQFIKGVFSDFDGTPSLSRMLTLPLTLSIIWALVHIVRAHDTLTEGEAMALCMVGGFLYFGNQGKAIMAAYKGNIQGSPPPEVKPPNG